MTKTRVHLVPGPRARKHPCGSRSHNGSFRTDNLELVTCRGCQGYLLRRRRVAPLFGPADGYAVTAALRVPYVAEVANNAGGVRIHFWLGFFLHERELHYSELAALVTLARTQKDLVAWTYCEGVPLTLRLDPYHLIAVEQAESIATTLPLPLWAYPSEGGEHLQLDSDRATKTLLDAQVNPQTHAWDAAWAVLERRAQQWAARAARQGGK